MSRIVAIDYGRKRTGIAVSDTMQLIANGLTTVPTHELLNFIGDYIAKEPVERIIVGLPMQMNNEVSENIKNIEPFVRSLKKRFPDIPVEMYHYVGNTSLAGAYAMLCSTESERKVYDLAANMTYIELSTIPQYMDEFVGACFLPHTDASLFPNR